MQTDPIGYYDSMNLYQYCINNPVNWVDPYGLFSNYSPGIGIQIPDWIIPQIQDLLDGIKVPDSVRDQIEESMGMPPPNPMNNNNGKCLKGDKVGGNKQPIPGKKQGNKGPPEPKRGKNNDVPDNPFQKTKWGEMLDNIASWLGGCQGNGNTGGGGFGL